MSNTSPAQEPESTDPSITVPRAVIHRRILNEAESRPTASLSQLATAVSGASVPLIERVLDEYGDPGESRTGPASSDSRQGGSSETVERAADADEDTNRNSEELPSASQLSIQQKRTLQAIYEHPDATQRDLAKVLDVSAATICQRVKSIQGFEWSDRRAFVSKLFDAEEMLPGAPIELKGDDSQIASRVDQSADRLDTLEAMDGNQAGEDLSSINGQLALKVVHACIQSEHLSVEEELQVVQAFLGDLSR